MVRVELKGNFIGLKCYIFNSKVEAYEFAKSNNFSVISCVKVEVK